MDIYFFIMCIWNKVQPFYPLTTVRYVGNLFNSQDDVENNFKVILTFIAEWLTNNRLFTNCYIRIKSNKYRFWNSNAKYVVVWRPDRFEHRCQIAQLVTHLTRDLGGLDSNPGLIRHYFSHPVKSLLKNEIKWIVNSRYFDEIKNVLFFIIKGK